MHSTTPTAGTGADWSDPERHRALDAAEIVDLLRLRPGMTVAEMGAGAGRFTLLIAEAVGPGGHVFALEAAPELQSRFQQRCRDRHNIHLIEAAYHQTLLACGCCDRVLTANLWPELAHPRAALREAARLLREDGRLVITDSRSGLGLSQMVNTLERNCWDIHRHGNAGSSCYFLEAAPSDESVQS
jgi:ubiquinone/menaquinone biosynthesis C-methylase UbiE